MKLNLKQMLEDVEKDNAFVLPTTKQLSQSDINRMLQEKKRKGKEKKS
ncbi:MAG: hypothetical protein WCJ02_03995 [bacterium]